MKESKNQKTLKEADRTYLDKIATPVEAIRLGLIKMIELIYLMAAEEPYTDVLPELRKEFFLPSNHKYYGKDWVRIRAGCNVEIKTGIGCRRCYWINLLRRWTGVLPNELKKEMKPIPYIPCYWFDKVSGEYYKIDRSHKITPNWFYNSSIKLEDFLQYMKDIEKTYQLQLPSPKWLYPDEAYPDISQVVENQGRIATEFVDDIQESERKSLTGKEARELGQLRKEKLKWDDSIVAAVKAGLFCSSQGRSITKKELDTELYQQKLGQIHKTTFDRIWKAIPQELRSLGGRPKESS